MCAIQWVLLKSCIFGLCISVTEAGVMLKTVDGMNTYSIGTDVELVCSITPYNNEMTWFVNNDPYADCIVGTCNPYSNKPYAFSFTFNETAGVFKLAIGSVTYSHADLSFACDDGIERKQISFSVTAVANEGNGDNDDRTLVEGAIAGIVVGSVVVIVVPIAVIVDHLHKRTKRLANTVVASTPQDEAQLEQQLHWNLRLANTVVAPTPQDEAQLEQQLHGNLRLANTVVAPTPQDEAQMEQQLHGEQYVDIKENIEDLTKEPENCCIILQGLLGIEKLLWTIVNEARKVLILKESAELVNNPTFSSNVMKEWIKELQWIQKQEQTEHETIARSKMQELVNNPTFSSNVMKGFVKKTQFFDCMISQLQENRNIYESIEKGIQNKTIQKSEWKRLIKK